MVAQLLAPAVYFTQTVLVTMRRKEMNKKLMQKHPWFGLEAAHIRVAK